MATPVPTNPDLTGKVAIITGASRGIGAAARTFAAAGATVVLAARDEQALAALAEDIVASGSRALAVPTDVGDPTSVERLVAQTLDAYGRLDAAFNNAGDGHMPAPLADVALDDFDRAVRVNLRGVFLCMKYEIPAMLESGGGAIVNMSSTAGNRVSCPHPLRRDRRVMLPGRVGAGMDREETGISVPHSVQKSV